MTAFQTLVRSSLCSLAIAICFSATANAQYGTMPSPPEDLKAGFDSINLEQSKEWLGILAGPGFEGRGTGQPGYTKAAHWVAGETCRVWAGANWRQWNVFPNVANETSDAVNRRMLFGRP